MFFNQHKYVIALALEKRKCPQPGRYTVIDYSTSGVLSTTPLRQRRGVQSMKPAQKLTWPDDSEDEECNVSELQIGCGSSDQSEMIIANTCERDQLGKLGGKTISSDFLLHSFSIPLNSKSNGACFMLLYWDYWMKWWDLMLALN